MTNRKPRKRAYIPPSHEVVNKRETPAPRRTPRTANGPRAAGGGGRREFMMEPPSWRRTLRRVPVYYLMIFALQYFLLKDSDGNRPAMQERLIGSASIAAMVTIAFLPMMMLMERWQYTRWLRRTGRLPARPVKGGGDNAS